MQPQVTLDTTLAELYARDSSENHGGKIALVLCAANSEISPTLQLTRNSKYLYQDSTFSTIPEHLSTEKHKEIQRLVAIKYLSLVPQHDAFAAGKMPVILFDPDAGGKKTSYSKDQVEKTMDSLTTQQRPTILFFSSPKQILMEENGIGLLAAKMELDDFEGFPMTVGLETHYFLNSKAAICSSGLPSPKSTLVELEGFSITPESCCSICRSNDSSRLIPPNCTGTRKPWLKSQIARMISKVSAQPLPFVLKNQQTFGGGGTFAVSSPEDLLGLQTTLSTQILPKLLSQVNSSNAHLKPATLIVSEMITDLVGDWGLTFFVTTEGGCVFLAVTEQIVDSTKAWIGSTISYAAQDGLKQKFTPIMHAIGNWLHQHGYYGPCGADILEAAPKGENDDTSTRLHIVDLNVRTSGSLVLGLMKGHFSERRDFHEASSFSISTQMARDPFITNFEDQFQKGQMVIVSWYEDSKSGVSFGNIVVGAKDERSLEKEVAKIKELGLEIHF